MSKEGVIPFSRRFDSSKYSHLKLIDLGEVTMSARQIFDNVMKCTEEFGDYHMETNNCQHFCQVMRGRLHLALEDYSDSIFGNSSTWIIYC